MIQKMNGNPDRNYRAWVFLLIAGLLFLCLVPCVMADAMNMTFKKAAIDFTDARQAAVGRVLEGTDLSKLIGRAPSCSDPLTITPPLPVKNAAINQDVQLTFKVESQNGVRQNINMTIKSEGVTFNSPSPRTNSAGEFSATFMPNRPGTYVVCATASTPLCSAFSSINVSVIHTKPVAAISASPSSPGGPNPLVVTFDGSGSTASDAATITGYAWEFSEGGTANTMTVLHTFQKAGTYTAFLQVTDSFGEKSPKVQVSYVVSARESLTVQNASAVGPVKENEPSEFQIKVSTKDGKPFPGVNVSVTSSNPAVGSVSPRNQKTDSNGLALFVLTGVKAGNITITATADDPMYLNGVREMKVRINPPDSPLPFILIATGAFIVLIILLILAYLWTRSRFLLKPKLKEIPADGRSATPIRVQFANGFGMLKKQRSDREIHLEATAGKIMDIVIPAGREYVDATLTSSKECGLVTVTATTEDKSKATTEVRFTGDEAGIEVQITPPEIPADGTSTGTIILKVRDRNGMYLSYLDEKVIGLTTTLGTVPPVVRIEPRAQSGTASILSSDKTGTALVRARSGSIAGEGSVVFKGLAMRYCMHCGKQMEMEAPSCPYCGKIPPSGVDTKQCSTCNAVLPQPAIFCDKCGARQSR